jgi:hypothetical protein
MSRPLARCLTCGSVYFEHVVLLVRGNGLWRAGAGLLRVHTLSGGDHGSGGGSILNKTRSVVCNQHAHDRANII